jgi:hypothetical protein
MERDSMKKTRTKKKHLSAHAIVRLADNGKDVSHFFTNSDKMMKPIQRVNVDFTASMLEELEAASSRSFLPVHAPVSCGSQQPRGPVQPAIAR